MVDHMVLRLGKYLRIIGCDAAWDRTADTRSLIHRANREHRVLITRNTHPADQHPLPQFFFLVKPDDPVRQFHEVVRHFGLNTSDRLFSRCFQCNALLEVLAKDETLSGKLPARIVASHTQFFQCPQCRHIFWKGTHVRNTLQHLGLSG